MLKMCKERLLSSNRSLRNNLQLRQLTVEQPEAAMTANDSNTGPSKNRTNSTSVMMEKTYIFWIIIAIMYVLSTINIVMIICIMKIIGYNENPRLENYSNNGSVLFTKRTECSTVYKEDGEIRTFDGESFEINCDGITISVKDKNDELHDKLIAINDGVTFAGVKRFDITDPATGTNIFATANVNALDLSPTRNLSTLNVDRQLSVSQIIGPDDSSLLIKSDKRTQLRGNLGIRIAGRELNIIAEGDIRIENVNSSVYLYGTNVTFDNVKILPPISAGSRDNANTNFSVAYKLCICMPAGKLFLVTVPVDEPAHLACSYVDESSPAFPCND